jgi:hypothetical protein
MNLDQFQRWHRSMDHTSHPITILIAPQITNISGHFTIIDQGHDPRPAIRGSGCLQLQNLSILTHD